MSPPGLDPPGVSPPTQEQQDAGVWARVTKEGFQAEPLLLADSDAGVGERVVEDLGKGVRSGGAVQGERCAPQPLCPAWPPRQFGAADGDTPCSSTAAQQGKTGRPQWDE